MSFGFKDGTVVDVMNNLGDGGIKIQCFRKDDSFCPDKPNNNDPKDSRADQLRKLFKSQDKDGSGKIPPGAAYALLKQYLDGNKDTKDFADSKYIEQILQKMTSQPGEVGLSEIFCISKYLTKVGEAYNLFNAEDKSGDGTLSNKEAEESLVEFYTKYSGVQVPDDCKTPQCTMHRQQIMQQAQKAAASFFNKVDGNQDKKISFDEYEKDAFKEIHFRPQDCQAAAKPTLEKENGPPATMVLRVSAVRSQLTVLNAEFRPGDDLGRVVVEISPHMDHRILPEHFRLGHLAAPEAGGHQFL